MILTENYKYRFGATKKQKSCNNLRNMCNVYTGRLFFHNLNVFLINYSKERSWFNGQKIILLFSKKDSCLR